MIWGTIGIVGVGILTSHTPVPHELAELNDKLGRDPGNIELLLERSEANRILRRHESALFDLELVLLASPQEAEVQLHRGRIYLAMGKYAIAEHHLDGYVQRGANKFNAHWFRGRSRERQGKHSEALLDYRAALQLKRSIAAYSARARMENKLGLKEAAANTLLEGLSSMNGAVTLRASLIELELSRGGFAQVVSLVEPALSQARIKTRWLLLRARAFEGLGNSQKAQADRMTALSHAERQVKRRGSPASLVSRAKVLAALGRKADAQRDVRRALQRAPRLESARMLSAELFGGER